MQASLGFRTKEAGRQLRDLGAYLMDRACKASPMRDWLFILVPIAFVAYFLAYPGQFTAFVRWLTNMLQ
jgi:hypothetical protein